MVVFQLPTGDVLDKLLLLLVLASMAFGILWYIRTLLHILASRKKDTTRWIKSQLNLTAAANTADVSYFGAGRTREYTYKGAAHFGVKLVEAIGVASIFICVLAAVVLISLALQSDWPPTIEFIRCVLICDLAAGWFLGAGLINALPTVWVGEEGIAISVYFTRRVMIPWADLVDVKRWPVLPGCYLVRARRITPMHQLYGWLARTRLPGFIIHQSIVGRDELFHELGQRVPTTH
jgi:hypothetical protein